MFDVIGAMAYARTVWYEPKLERTFSDVIPSNWIIDETVYWPSSSFFAKYFKNKADPDINKWAKFKLLKIKMKSNNYEELKLLPDTDVTADEEQTQQIFNEEKPPARDASYIHWDDIDDGSETGTREANV